MAKTKGDGETAYAVPAIDKALDILELLANQKEGLSQGQLSEAVGRSLNQIYRVLVALERRGYIYRDRSAGLYFLSMMMFELAHRHDPVRGLIQIAMPPMRRLADEIEQSCNLSILHAERVIVLAQVESAAPFGFRVRVGAEFPILDTATGHVLLAFGSRDGAEASTEPPRHRHKKKNAALERRLDRVHKQGYDEIADSIQPGIIDIAYPIIGRGRTAIAALTVPYVSTTYSKRDLSQVHASAARAAKQIGDGLRGRSAG